MAGVFTPYPGSRARAQNTSNCRASPLTLSERHPRAAKAAIAVVCVLAAFGLRWSLSTLLEDRAPFLLFIVSTLVVTWRGGALPGVGALFTGGLLAVYFFMPPYHSLQLETS